MLNKAIVFLSILAAALCALNHWILGGSSRDEIGLLLLIAWVAILDERVESRKDPLK